MSLVELRQVTHVHPSARGPGVPAVAGIDLAVTAGERLVIAGPSGSGKTTLLRLLAGLEEPSAGTVLLDGQPASQTPPARRGVAFVFQEGALYPHLTARENLTVGLEWRKVPPAEIARRIAAVSATLQLTDALDRRPEQLSGGERQRVALGRALVQQPRLLLLDEPLASLDLPLRRQLRRDIVRAARELGLTLVYVTHDQEEALAVATRLLVLRGGRVEQAGPPLDLYDRPATRFVAGFLGSPGMNFLPVTLGPDGGRAWLGETEGCPVPVPATVARQVLAGGGRTLTAGIRPEAVRRAAGVPTESDWRITGVITEAEHYGTETQVTVETGGHSVVVRLPRGEGTPGTAFHGQVPAAAVHYFATSSGAALV